MQCSVMTYNIRTGTFNPFGLEGVARVIERQQPDVVGLQEVNVNRYQSGPVDQPRWLGQRLGMESAFGVALEFDEKNLPGQKGAYGNALLSRFPIRASAVFPLPRPSPQLEQRIVLAASLQPEDGPLNLFVTHWGLDAAERAAQAEATAAFLRSWQPGPPAVLLGDFNALPDSPEIATVRGVLDDAWERAAVPLERRLTFPSGPAGSRTPSGWSGAIDYIFLSPARTVEHIAVVYDEDRASDHNPVLAQLRW